MFTNRIKFINFGHNQYWLQSGSPTGFQKFLSTTQVSVKNSTACSQSIGACLVGLLMSLSVSANNLSVTNPTTTGQDAGADTALVQCDVSWDNSWRDATNWDAAWLFVKYRDPATSGNWAHATLSSTAGNHTAPSGSTIEPASDGTGVFIYRSGNGTGSNNFTGVQLQWNYGTDGVADGANVDAQVFAIEMVLVAQGAFRVGSGGAGNGELFEGGGGTTPFLITSEAAITVGDSSGQLWGASSSGTNSNGGAGTIPAAFPKGFAGFYCMKYEISQGQYAAFLNALTSTQAAARFPNKNGTSRHTLGGTHPNFSATAADRACNFLGWKNGAAYSDWSGLRPMTGLEYEKACRGTAAAVLDEYAWGDTTITAATGVSADGTASEAANAPSGANVSAGSSIGGPLRVGSFATASSTRAQAGASFYGVMELSGNLWERPVTIGNSAGRSFTGLHGDGSLSGNDANVTNWPSVTTSVGVGSRSGAWDNTVIGGPYPVSNRAGAADSFEGGSNHGFGFRGVRSQPTP